MDDITKGLVEHLRKNGSHVTVRENPRFIPVQDVHSVSQEQPMNWRYCPACDTFYGFLSGGYDTHCLFGHEFSRVVNRSLFEHLTLIWHLFYAGQDMPMLPNKELQQIRQFLDQWKDIRGE